MKNTNVTLIQSFLALLVIITNATLQTMALVELNKVNLMSSDPSAIKHLEQSKKILLIALIVQFSMALVMILVTFAIFRNRTKLEIHMNKLIYFAVFLSGILMVASGTVGAVVGSYIQCYKYNPNIYKAWQYSTITAVSGILGALLILMVQGFIRRSTIKAAALRYLGVNLNDGKKGSELSEEEFYDIFASESKKNRFPSAMKSNWQSDQMPTYHPSSYRRTSDLH